METKFLVDVNVGRLGKWLRIMGYDARFIPHAEDRELVQVAMREDRVLLTRDTHIAQRRVASTGQLRVLLVRGDDVMGQLRQVAEELGLDQQGRPFSLCVQCNVPLRPRPKESLAGLVPPHVFATQEEFMECPACRRLYWRGTHWSRMRGALAQLRESGRGDGE